MNVSQAGDRQFEQFREMLDLVTIEQQLLSSVWREIDSLEFANDDRARLAAQCYFIVLEHQLGFYHLLEKQVIVSALALIRPLTEAFTRGVWLHHAASDQQVAAFSDGKSPPQIGQMMKALEKK